MKHILCAIALMLISSSAFALNSLDCNVRMKTSQSDKYWAPLVTGQGLYSILKARHHGDYLFLNFNPATVSTSSAHAILDGRNKNIPLNSLLSISEKNGIITFVIKDTETHRGETLEFDLNSEITVNFENGKASFEMRCLAI